MPTNRSFYTRVADAIRDDQEVDELATTILKAARMRGVTPEVLEAIEAPDGGNAAVWSKTYTENSSSRLISKDGKVLFETSAPLTHSETELIEKLGLAKRR